jgi:glycine/D-amino acid oxidase-like deaminating enzyme
MDYAIIGNGILAYMTAYKLSKDLSTGDKIIIVGSSQRLCAATIAAPAMLNSFAEIEEDTFDSDAGRYRFQLSMESTKEWPLVLLELYNDCKEYYEKKYGAFHLSGQTSAWFDQGTYIINNTAADELDDVNFNSICSALTRFNQSHEIVDPSSIPNYKPEQRYRATRAVFINNEGWFNPLIFLELLDHYFQNHDRILLVDDIVVEVMGDDLITGIKIQNGRVLNADKFIFAAGASTVDLLNASGLNLNLQKVFYGVGVTLKLNSPFHKHTKCIRTPNRGLACGIYSAPYFQSQNKDDAYLAVGATNFVSPVQTEYARLTSASTLMNALIQQINQYFYKAELIKINVGSRPLSQDGFPLLGQSSIENLYILTGTRREGIHLAPAICRRVVDLIVGNSVEKKFNIFNPSRKLIHTMTREQGIDKALRNHISAIYQHGFLSSEVSLLDKLKQDYRSGLEHLYDDLGIYDWGIPVDMIDMYRYGHAKNY